MWQRALTDHACWAGPGRYAGTILSISDYGMRPFRILQHAPSDKYTAESFILRSSGRTHAVPCRAGYGAICLQASANQGPLAFIACQFEGLGEVAGAIAEIMGFQACCISSQSCRLGHKYILKVIPFALSVGCLGLASRLACLPSRLMKCDVFCSTLA